MEAGSTRPVRSPEPGEVRITEWMANPRGPDADFEWVEVAFADDADLNGFQLGAAPDSLEVAVDQSDCVPVDAGERVVFGASPRAAPRVDAELGFSLGNSNARSIVAAFEGVELDRVDYDHTVEGSAWLLDAEGAVCLAASTDEYAPGNFGTPGQPNPPCPPVLLDGMCLEDDRARKIVSPTPGQVRITEWMASPAAAEDRDGEWVELHFTAAADLNGLTLSDLSGATTTVEGESCAGVSAGTRVVFVRNLDPTRNGGLQDADAQLSISLNNQNETITLSIDGETLDSITYARSETGASTQIDEAGNVCTASSPYGDGDLGTPGSANPHCP